MTAESLKLRCLRCNHSWLRRTDDAPKCCPNCKSRRWFEVRQPKSGKASGKNPTPQDIEESVHFANKVAQRLKQQVKENKENV